MHLTPEFVADILVRQGYLKPEQGEAIKQEARALPRNLRSANAFEQKAVAYELILQMRLPSQRDSGSPLTEAEVAQAIAGDAKLDHVRIDALNLNADLIESKMSRPFAKPPSHDPARHGRGKAAGGLRQPLRHRRDRLLPAHRRA